MSSSTSRLSQMKTEELLKYQESIRAEQDKTLDRMLASVQRIKATAVAIGQELNEQKETLEDIDDAVHKSTGKLKRMNKKVDDLNNGKTSWLSLFGW